MKIDKSFPRKYLESRSCGDGFYESTGSGLYKHPGVDAEAVIGSEVRITDNIDLLSLLPISEIT